MQSHCIFNTTSVEVSTANILELNLKTNKNLSNVLFIIWSSERKSIAISVSTKWITCKNNSEADSEGKKYPFLVKHGRKKFQKQVFDRNIWSNKPDKPKC